LLGQESEPLYNLNHVLAFLEEFNPGDERELRVLKNKKHYGTLLKLRNEILKSWSVSVKKNSTEMKMHHNCGRVVYCDVTK
jgi:hypothetical protein